MKTYKVKFYLFGVIKLQSIIGVYENKESAIDSSRKFLEVDDWVGKLLFRAKASPFAKAEYVKKYVVVRADHLSVLSSRCQDRFEEIINLLAKIVPVSATNEYYVCNQDEPYAKEVLDVILKGEDAK